MNKTLSVFLSILFLYLQTGFSDELRSLESVIKETNKLFYLGKNNIKAEMVDSTVPVYVAWAFVTLPMSFEKAAPYFMDIENYDTIFKYITDMRLVKEPKLKNDSVYYIEGKSGPVHGWGLGKLKTLKQHGNSLIELEVRPAPHWLVDRYRIDRKGVIPYYIRDAYLDGRLLRIDDKHCRIGIRGITSTNVPMPMWLVNFIVQSIFPSLLNDAVSKINRSP